MGTCHEFGPSIQAGCDHPMQANRPDACTCVECGVVCHGKFAGCPTVWARGPQAVRWKPAGADPGHAPMRPGLAARVTPPAPAQMTAPDLPGVDEMASAIRRLVAEVGRLRQDLDEQRATVDSLVADITAEVRLAVSEASERALRSGAQPVASPPQPAGAGASPPQPAEGRTSSSPAPRSSLWQDRTA